MEIDINNLTAYQEDHRIEAKTAKNQIPNSIWETYSSFANTEGGIILLGVVEENDHSLSVKGVEDAHKLIGDFWKMFGLLDFGERAGSGIPDLFDICNSELGTQPDYDVTYAPARTTLTIDISKMAHTERTIKADGKVIMDDNDKADDKSGR